MNKFIRTKVKTLFSVLNTLCALSLIVFFIRLMSDNPVITIVLLVISVAGMLLVEQFKEHTIQSELKKRLENEDRTAAAEKTE